MDLMEKQNRARQQLEERLRGEAQQQYNHEQAVSNMEREEMELINRLKNTKMLEDAANSELEFAFSCPDPDKQLKTRSAGGKRPPGSRGGPSRGK
jgi:hypothetical protein